MSEVFISYARSTAPQARQVADALRALGYSVWRDDELPAHRAYAEVIEERLTAARAVVVIWSAEATRSQWVFSEANRAREDGKLVQMAVDGARLPMPFDSIQCADLAGWRGDTDAPGWRKVVASIADLVGTDVAPAQVGGGATLPGKPSIAVLPFANLSGDAEQDYFADGMVVEIVAALSRVRSIFVIASGSSLALKGQGLGPRDAARRLGVRYGLEGSVRKAGGRVRIAVHLIDADDGSQIWTHRFEDTLDDVFALQDQVALSAAGVIEPAVREAEVRRAATRPTDNMGSYDLYLRALSFLRTYVRTDVFKALDMTERAIGLDPEHGAATALACRINYLIDLYGWARDSTDHRARAIELGRRALRLVADDAWSLSNVATVMAFCERDIQGALTLIDRALTINPGCSAAWTMRGAVGVLNGRFDQAVEDFEVGMRLDPMGPDRVPCILFKAMARLQQRRFDEAVALARELVQQTDNPTGCAILAAGYGHLGQTVLAAEALERYRTLAPQPIETYARAVWHDPAHVKLFLDGVALAGGGDVTA